MLDRVDSISRLFLNEEQEGEVSSFARNVLSLLERVEYRRCESGEDLEAIYRLRYKAYRLHGFLSESSDQMMSDALDDAPNCYRFGVFVDDALVCTVRIHHLSPEQPDAPAMTTFGDILRPRLLRGESFINPTLLAAEPEFMATNRALPYITLRLGLVASIYFDATACIGVIRAEHTAFYRRVFGAVQVGQPRNYPPFTVPVMLYDANCALNRERILRRFPFFNSTAIEQRLLFRRPERGETVPLTILPTAKYSLAAA
jgi:N-acyl amino acid synthase FeeM